MVAKKCLACSKVFQDWPGGDRKYCSYLCYKNKRLDKSNRPMKQCTKCKKEKTKSEYILNKGRWNSECRECHNERNKIRKYGVDSKRLEELLVKQEYKCLICGNINGAERMSKLVIDHNHRTGRVRGLLCVDCNLGLGRFKDNIELLAKAINYLIKDNGLSISLK